MYWDRYIHRDNPRRIEPLDKPLDMYVMLDTETTGLHPEEGATLIEIGAFLVQPGNENSRRRYAPFPPMARPDLAGRGAVDHHRPQRRIRRQLP